MGDTTFLGFSGDAALFGESPMRRTGELDRFPDDSRRIVEDKPIPIGWVGRGGDNPFD